MYDMAKLNAENEDGITILFYLQKIYPGGCFFLFQNIFHKFSFSLHFIYFTPI